jgi:hypothetical protein
MDPLEHRLHMLLVMVNDWLRFAEAKNAILLPFVGGGTGILVSHLSSATTPSTRLLLAIIFTSLLGASLVTLLSFMPQIDIKKVVERQIDLQLDHNLFYYGHLALYNAEELTRALSERLAQSEISRDSVDLAEQVVINARIALRKHNMFTLAIRIVLVGSALSIVVALLPCVWQVIFSGRRIVSPNLSPWRLGVWYTLISLGYF